MFTRTTASSHSYSIIDCPPTGRRPPATDATKWRRSTIEVAPNCPRCASTNTKFCYYNNYSLSQPRYFCKACRRYWTKGGSLRNVPVGGGCRKSRRARSSRAGQISISDPSPDARPQSTPCIDLAAVFAKYVSPSAEGDEPSISPVPSSGSSENHSQIEGGGSIFECHREVALMDVSFVLADQFPAAQEMDGWDFAALDPIELRHGLIGGDLAETTLWPSEVTNLPDFGTDVQSGMQFPDLGLFSGEDHFRVSPGDNWIPFDMPGCEPFCNPCYI